MPIWDVKCEECGEVGEQLLKLNVDPTECRYCNSAKVVKLVGAAALRFKGSGFYCTDYKQGTDKRESLSDEHRKTLYDE